MGKIQSLLQSSLLRNALKLSSSNIILYALPLIVTPILSRIYTPDIFGGWGIFSSTVVIIGVMLFGCYEYVIIKAEPTELRTICFICIITAIILIILILCSFELGESIDIAFFKTFPSKTLLIIYLLFSIGLVIGQNLANRFGKYTLLASDYLILGLSQALCRVMFGFLHIFQNGLIAGTVFAQGIASTYIILRLKKYLKSFYKYPGIKDLKETASKYKSFPLYDAPASLLAFGAFNLPIIILSFYYSRGDIGCFSIIIQLLLLPMSFIGAAIGKVFYQEISTARNDRDIIKNKSKNILKILSYLSLLPAIFILLGGNLCIVWFLGDKWELAGAMSISLSIWSIPTILTQPLLPIYRNLGKQKRMLYYNALYFLAGIGSVWIGCELCLSLIMTLCLFAGSCFFAKMLLFSDILNITQVEYRSLPKPSIFIFFMIILAWVLRNFIFQL